MFLVPGKSYRGPLPPLTELEVDLAKRLKAHIQLIAGEIGARSLTCAPQNLELVAAYIERSFKTNRFRVESQVFSVDLHVNGIMRSITSGITRSTFTTRNVIAEVTGTDRAEEIVIVGAHYDSVYDCPAANDNGTGVAATLEIARLLSEFKPRRTLRFVTFPNEEPPFFRSDDMGSLRYVRLCRERNEKIVAMFSLETMGYYSDAPNSQQAPSNLFFLIYPNTGNFIGFVSNWASRNLLAQAIKAFRSSVQFPSEGAVLSALVSGVDLSDHWAFWEYGYPAIMITDTAFYRYPHYHTNEDTPDKIDYDRFARVVRGLAEVVKDVSS
jgi:Zn-dependent M28 family amino/carboxypeptidase